MSHFLPSLKPVIPHDSNFRSEKRHWRKTGIREARNETAGLHVITETNDTINIKTFDTKSSISSLLDRERLDSWSDKVVIICIEGWRNDLHEELISIFPRYPKHLGTFVRDGKVRHPYIPAESGSEHGDIAFVLNYRGRRGDSREISRPQDADREVRVGAWIGSYTSASGPEDGHLIILLFPKHGKTHGYYAKMMERQYKEHRIHLFRRLKFQPAFVFMDLYRMFTSWDGVIEKLSHDYNKVEEMCFNRVSRVIPRVSGLHRMQADISLIREQLHTHDVARKRYVKLVERLYSFAQQRRNLDTRVSIQSGRLLDRLDDVEDEISTQVLILEMLSDRFRNLIDLEFNVAGAKMDIRVAAISVLAFAIAPVSFVAAIFGITTFQANIMYFIISGSIVAISSVLSWLAIHAYYSNIENARGNQSRAVTMGTDTSVGSLEERRRHDPEMGATITSDEERRRAYTTER